MIDKSLKSIRKTRSKYRICGSLWIECDGERFFGPGRVELLEKIEKTGSINKAAKEMEMSYKKAWEMINALNSQAQQTTGCNTAGGEKGGGSVITEEAFAPALTNAIYDLTGKRIRKLSFILDQL